MRPLFDAITLNVKFDIAEIHQVSPEWAFALTNSAGRVKVQATGEGAPKDNQELMTLRSAVALEYSWTRLIPDDVA